MAPLEFRAWDTVKKRWLKPEKFCIASGTVMDRKGKVLKNVLACQYIGREDLNGKKIFEGDILKYWKPKKGPCEYCGHEEPEPEPEISFAFVRFGDEYSFILDWEEPNPDPPDKDGAQLVAGCEEGFEYDHVYEVVGNVFENPELVTNSYEYF